MLAYIISDLAFAAIIVTIVFHYLLKNAEDAGDVAMTGVTFIFLLTSDLYLLTLIYRQTRGYAGL
jgi:hypothetical protein